jgi:hypothetical protein
MDLANKKSAAFGLLTSTVLAGPVAADGEWRPSTDPFDPPRIYITPDATALTYTTPSRNLDIGGMSV